MEEKFQLLKVRDFNDIVNDSINFIKTYFKSIGYSILVMVIPVYILGSFIYANVMPLGFNMGRNLNMFSNMGKVAGSAVAGGFILLIGRALMTVIFVSAFIHVEQSETGELTDRDIFSSIRTYLGRLVSFYLVVFLVIVVSFLLIAAVIAAVFASVGQVGGAVVLFFIGVALFFGIVYIAVPLTFVPIIYMREMCGLSEAVSRTFYLVRDNWWWTFLILSVAGLLGGVIGIIFQVPYMTLTFAKTFATLRGGGTGGFETSLIDRLALTLQNFGGIVTYTIVTIAAYLQYYSLVEKKDGLGLMNQIEGIGAEGTSNHTGIGRNDTNY